MSYTCQQIPKEKFASVVDLWSLAFNINDSDKVAGHAGEITRQLEYLENGIDYVTGIFDGDRLASVAGIIYFPMFFAGKWLTCGGIVGVASSPEYRRQRLVRKVMANCVDQMIEREIPLTSLWPFSYSFYEQLGWSTSDFRFEIDVELSGLRKVRGDALKYRTHSYLDFESAQKVHDRWVERFNLSMQRSEARWKRQLNNANFRTRLFVHKDGYMLWNLTQSTNMERLEVTEWCYLTDDAFRDGLALLAQMDSQYKRARWQSAETDSLHRIVGADKTHEIKMVPGMMTRAAHTETLLSSFGYLDAKGIDIIDPIHGPVDEGFKSKWHAGPGQLIQHLLGMWEPNAFQLPPELHGIAGDPKSFCIEKY